MMTVFGIYVMILEEGGREREGEIQAKEEKLGRCRTRAKSNVFRSPKLESIRSPKLEIVSKNT
jgi:hypothetical protein